MATPETKRDLFASAENDLKSNSGGHYLKERAAPRAIAKPVRQERSGRVGVKGCPRLGRGIGRWRYRGRELSSCTGAYQFSLLNPVPGPLRERPRPPAHYRSIHRPRRRCYQRTPNGRDRSGEVN